jgi:hypothetical protein
MTLKESIDNLHEKVFELFKPILDFLAKKINQSDETKYL